MNVRLKRSPMADYIQAPTVRHFQRTRITRTSRHSMQPPKTCHGERQYMQRATAVALQQREAGMVEGDSRHRQ